MSKFRLNLIKAFSVLFAVCIGFAITSMPAKAEDANFSVTQGASIRNGESDGFIGLQFESSVNGAWLEGKTVKQFGTLIYPTANEIASYDNKTLSDIVDELDAVNIIRSENTSGNFNASIVYDRQSVIEGIEGKGATASDELVNSVLKNLYNKEFSARSYAILNDNSVVYTTAHSNSMYRTAIRTYASDEDLALNYFESASSVEANIYGNDLALTTETATTFTDDAIVILNDKVLTKQADYNVENGTIVLTYSAVQALALEGTQHTFYIIDNDENVDINNDKDWLDVLTVVNAKLLRIEGIEVSEKEGAGYTPTQNASQYLEFNYKYDDDSTSDKFSLNEDNITSVTVNGNTVTITVTVTVYNVEYTDTCEINVGDSSITVSDFIDATSVEEGSQFTLTGVVAGFATNIDQNEVILTDNGTNFVSVVGLGGGDVVNGSYYLNGIDVGYEISLPVERYTSDSGANSGKVYAKFVGVDETAVSVISNNKKNITLPAVSEEDKIVISSTSALETFLQGGNQYKVVTLKAEMNFVMENNLNLYDFWFYDDTQATSYDEIKVNGLIPTFSNVATQITVGKTFGELALDNADATSQDFNAPHNVIKEITALYLGGNATHAQFLLLNNSSVGNPTPIVSGYELVAPNKVYYTEEEINAGLDLTGCTIIKKYDIKSSEEISVVDNDAVTIIYPETYIVGVNTITVTFETQELTFDIEVQGKAIASIDVNEEDYAEYTQLSHRDSISNVSFENISATITYSDDTTEPLQLSSTMVTNPEDWNVGEVTYKLTHEGFEFDLVINYENKAYSVSQFLEGTGLTFGTAYDVHGLVAKTIYSSTTDEFLLKDIETNDVISIFYSEMVNTSLNFKDTIAIGDEVIVNLQLTISNTSSTNTNGNDGKIFGSAIDNTTFKSNLLILSNNNTIEFNLDEVTTTISSYEDLTNFLVNDGADSDTYTFKNFYQIVKLDGAKFSYKTAKQALLYFGDNITDETATKYGKWLISYDIDTSKKYISTSGTLNGALDKSVTVSSTTITNYASAPNHDIYAMFIGGTKSYLKFAILDESWIVEKTPAQA